MSLFFCALALLAPDGEVEPLSAFPELATVQPAAASAVEEEEEIELGWSGGVAVGLGLVTGNSDAKSFNVQADAIYRRKHDRTTLGALYFYEELNGAKAQDKQAARAQYDYFLSKKTYLLAQASYFADAIASLDSRVIAGVGAGHQFYEQEKLKLNGEAGVSYVDERYGNTTPPTPDDDYVSLRLAYNVNWTPTKAWELGQSLSYLPDIEDFSRYVLNSDVKAKVTLSDKLYAQLQWLHIFNAAPAAGAVRTDNTWNLGLGWSI